MKRRHSNLNEKVEVGPLIKTFRRSIDNFITSDEKFSTKVKMYVFGRGLGKSFFCLIDQQKLGEGQK